jgi:hypothetical protein
VDCMRCPSACYPYLLAICCAGHTGHTVTETRGQWLLAARLSSSSTCLAVVGSVEGCLGLHCPLDLRQPAGLAGPLSVLLLIGGLVALLAGRLPG